MVVNMKKIFRILLLIYSQFRLSLLCIDAIAITIVFSLNFCINQYVDAEIRIDFLNKVNYENIYTATFVRNKEENLKDAASRIEKSLGDAGIILNYGKNPLYTSIKNNGIITVRSMTRHEADLYHCFNVSENPDGIYQAIVSSDLRSIFSVGKVYNIFLGRRVNEMTQKIKININGDGNDSLFFAQRYGDIEPLTGEIIIYDPNDDLIINEIPTRKPIISTYLYIDNLEDAYKNLAPCNLIKIESQKNKLDNFSYVELERSPYYIQFVILNLFLYVLLYINFYLLFYFKKRDYISAFYFCNLTKKLYLLLISMNAFLRLAISFFIGQAIWHLYFWLKNGYAAHYDFPVFLSLFIAHLFICIFLNRGYKYIVKKND